MIGGLLDKITASLGKSYAFAGLLPAAILLAIVDCYRNGFAHLWNLFPASSDDLKSVTAIGVEWLIIGFREPRTMIILSLARPPLRRDDHFRC